MASISRHANCRIRTGIDVNRHHCYAILDREWSFGETRFGCHLEGVGSMICWSCNSENTDTNSFCADCGVPLDPKLEKLSAYVDDRITAALDAKFRDQKLVEYQVTEAVVGRLVSWGRGLAILAGVFITALGYAGFSEISGAGAFIEDSKKDIGDLIEDIKNQRDEVSGLLETSSREMEELGVTIQKLELRTLQVSLAVVKSDLRSGAFTEDAHARRIITWIWPNGIAAAPNGANVNNLRAWMDMDEAFRDLPIQKLLDSALLGKARQRAVTELNIPEL